VLILRYINISPKLVQIGTRWELSKGFFHPFLSPPNCFSRLTLWG
jgi:hypothetical protein